MTVRIEKSSTKIFVESPYNSKFVAKARDLGGKWEAPRWVFDIRDEECVRALCLEIYGENGRFCEKVTLRAVFAPGVGKLGDSIYLGGRVIATAFGRDSGAKIGAGVVVLNGGFSSGGSVKNWKTVTHSENGAIVLVRNVPIAIAEKLMAPGGLEGEKAESVSIEPEAPVVDQSALLAERTALLARISEIDSILSETKG